MDFHPFYTRVEAFAFNHEILKKRTNESGGARNTLHTKVGAGDVNKLNLYL
jgi:hypothetical protein